MEIRIATTSDLDFILELYNYEIIHSTAVYNYDPFDIQYIENWFQEKTKNNFPILICVDNGHRTGFATYGKFRMRPAYQYTCEHSVYVHQNHRRRGYAAALMANLLDVASENKIHSLIGGIDADNTESIRFHERLGFTEVAHIKEVGYKFERWLDLKFYQKIL